MYLGQKMITQLRYKCDSNTDESDEDKIIWRHCMDVDEWEGK